MARLDGSFYKNQAVEAAKKYKEANKEKFDCNVKKIQGMEKWLKEQEAKNG